ncbi:alpha/beta hydrolase family protein [Silvibacterium dinghuense]|uniref:PET hydrolase/cutinase-like domain-containing protein n=1 Tax=Silvibacterium dinghuense TaxID=1560006 RepID=A0A4Q1SKN7_9BACT|nr:dienelactone hydrolase family protein [Silvibacterium dinghuense]RXS98037.1 hypothetical protein ESZ00_09420 [Silvibacterium dinghuense]GGH04018.1 carboxylic ester hydrolase [Silvibacterium dinghuense]
MRPLEELLVGVLLLGLWLLWRRDGHPRGRSWLAAAGLLVLALHLGIEGPHWQMAPAYLAALLLPLALLCRRRAAVCGLLVLLLAATIASTIASWMLPMFRLPAPTGSYAIGTRVLEVTNPHPVDARFAEPDGQRRLVIQVWYPAEAHGGRRAAYRRLKETELKSTYQAVLWTHSRWNAPFAAGAAPMPVLLLNPAWGGRRTYYTYLTEELASHGYLVVGIDHTGNSGPTLFADGHVEKPVDGEVLDFETHTLAQLDAVAAQHLAIQADDDRFVLDELTRWNADPASPFYRRIDLTRVGALGHSFGGAVSVETARTDSRVKAALDMDGSFWGPHAAEALNKPLMMIEEDIDNPTAEALKDPFVLNNHLLDMRDATMLAKSHARYANLHGSTHSSFTDRSLYSPLRRFSDIGSIPAYREYAILRALTLAFFDQTLRGKASPLLDGNPHPFPEVTMTQK